MANFSYTARNSENAMQSGTIVANDRSSAIVALKNHQLTPVIVKEKTEKRGTIHLNKIPFIGNKVKNRDLAIMTRQLATMINAGVPIVRSLNTLKSQTDSANLKTVLSKVASEVEGGKPLSDALEKFPKVFSPVYVYMARAGEAGGILDDILNRLATQVEKDAEMKSKVRGAMIYPGIISFITLGAFVFLMTGIIPKLKQIFDQFEAQLPVHTRAMLAISNFLLEYGLFVLIGIVVAIVLLVRYKQTPAGKKLFDRLLLKVPIFGNLIMKVNVARFARTFSSLTGAGVSVLDGMEVTARSLSNVIISQSIIDASEKVKNGMPISAAIEDNHLFPPMITQMSAVGEETGQVDKVLEKVADFYEKEVDRLIANMTSIIEPLLIVFLGGLVGLIIASVFGPISSLSNVVK
jgi:type IV pilus assembly protein PilC